MTATRPRVILDCNILVQAILSPDGPGAECVALADAGKITLVTSDQTLAEARDVLNRQEIRALKPNLSPEQAAVFLQALSYRSVFLREVPRSVTWPRDPNDEPYLNLAVASDADYLVTRDHDLLALNTDHSLEAKQFRQVTRNRLRIVTPAQFIRLFAPE